MKKSFSKTLFALVIFSFFSTGALLFAQEADDASVDTVCALLSRANVTEGNFVQKKRAPNAKRALTSRGTFFINKEGVYLQTLKPVATAMGVTETTVITITADGNRTVIDNSKNALFRGMAKIIVDMLSGEKTALLEQFTPEITGTTEDWLLVLSPKDATFSSVIKALSLGGGKDLSLIVMETVNGSSVTYELSELTYKDSLTDGQKKLFAQK